MLDKLFDPNVVAVIGASRTEGKVGNAVLKNLIEYLVYHEPFKNEAKLGTEVLKNLIQRSGRKIIPINPNITEILGLPCYSDILNVPEKVDLAVIVVPASIVPATMEKCGQAGVRYVIVISAGFKEATLEGARLERDIINIAKRYNIRMVGPNCLGIIDTTSSLNASFAATMALTGNIAMMSQSGAICSVALDWADRNKVGFSKFISLGNKADLTENDFLEFFKTDDNTSVIAAYLEGVKDGPNFIQIARDLTRSKPLVIVKSGRTAVGSKAVSSHTGTLAGSDAAYTAAFKQAGVLRVDSLEELLYYSRTFSTYRLPHGKKIAILTNAGGLGIITADACYSNGLTITSLEESTVARLREGLPEAAGFYNPVDMLGDASSELYEYALQILLEDKNVDGIIALISPQSMTDVPAITKVLIKKIKSALKPILCTLAGGTLIMPGEKLLNDNNIPNYSSPENAVVCMKALCDYKDIQLENYESPRDVVANKRKAQKIIDDAIKNDIKILGLESMDILEAYNIPVVQSKIVPNLPAAIKTAQNMGYPVVMKIVSPDISHKTDVGGIKLNISNVSELEHAYNTMMTDVKQYMPKAKITGVQIQQMITTGKEVIIGMDRDPQFGPLLMFGLGGVYVEFLKDVSFAVAPINDKEAKQMVSSIKTYPLIVGVRGETPSDIKAIIDTLLKISQLSIDFPQIAEFEINPLMVMPEGKGCLAMDIRIILKP